MSLSFLINFIVLTLIIDFPSLSNPKLNEISNKTSYSQVHVEHESKVKEADQRLENVHWLPTKHPFLSSSFANPPNSKNTQDMLADFRLLKFLFLSNLSIIHIHKSIKNTI